MADDDGAVATMLIENPGTTWNYTTAQIGDDGKATLTIRDGAKAYGGWMTISSGTGTKESKVLVDGAGTELHIGSNGGAPGSGLTLGAYTSPGSMEITGGALVTSGATEIGYVGNLVNRITVRGEGTKFEHGFMRIGDYGNGLLELYDGSAHGSYVQLGGQYGATGQVLVSGPKASWQVDSEIDIGYSSHTTTSVRVNQGGHIATQWLLVGFGSDSTSLLDVEGAGSSVDVSTKLWIGDANSGKADMNIRNGAHVTAGSSIVGDSATGTATIQGTDSKLRVMKQLTIGRAGAYSFTPVDSVSVTAGGKLEVGQLLDIRTNGRLTVDSASRAVVGTETVLPAVGVVYVAADGALSGDGLIIGNVQNYGLVEPGASLGTLTVTGSYTQKSSGKLHIELGGTTAALYDHVMVTGATTLAGLIDVDLANQYSPKLGDVFRIIDSTQNIGGTFDQFNFPPLPATLGWRTAFAARSVSLTVVAVPEHSTLLLASAILGVVSTRRILTRGERNGQKTVSGTALPPC
jgi:fibronectin-binding autotransporter adhesin